MTQQNRFQTCSAVISSEARNLFLLLITEKLSLTNVLYQIAVKNGVLRICFKPGAIYRRSERFESVLSRGALRSKANRYYFST
ncbi:MAG: hypothetical protein BWK80_11770 [Desulfobacteraceae bacterium IS3]|nr:MAG: hypothetical protein BWK80_11770 [Desulfobacteraceae bacterium IS3]